MYGKLTQRTLVTFADRAAAREGPRAAHPSPVDSYHTRAPCARKALTVAAPKPEAPPVTRATVLDRLICRNMVWYHTSMSVWFFPRHHLLVEGVVSHIYADNAKHTCRPNFHANRWYHIIIPSPSLLRSLLDLDASLVPGIATMHYMLLV